MRELLDDLVEGCVPAVGEAAERPQERRLGALPDSVLEQVSLARREPHTDEQRLESRRSALVHAFGIPLLLARKRRLPRAFAASVLLQSRYG